MSTSGAYRDFDYERRFGDVKRLEKAVHHFNQTVGRGMVAMKEIASAFEAVGGVLAEMTSANAMATHYMEPKPTFSGDASDAGDGEHAPFPAPVSVAGGFESASMVSASLAPGSHIDEDAAGQMHKLTLLFADEARRLNEGQPFLLYNTGVHRDVVNRLIPIVNHLKTVDDVSKKRDEALLKYQKYKSIVEKKEQNYAKKGKAFVDNVSYIKYARKRDETWKVYVEARTKFYDAYRLLMEVHGHAVAHIVHRYLTLNGGYLRELLSAVERVLPAMERIYPANTEFASQASSILTAVAVMDKKSVNVSLPHKEENSAMRKGLTSGGDENNIHDSEETNNIYRLASVKDGRLDDKERWEDPPQLQSGKMMVTASLTPLPGAVDGSGNILNERGNYSRQEMAVFSSVATAPAVRVNSQYGQYVFGAPDDEDRDDIMTSNTLSHEKNEDNSTEHRTGNTLHKDPCSGDLGKRP